MTASTHSTINRAAINQPAINQNVANLSAPPVAVVQDWISSYDGRHGPLIDLSQAVPGYPPHPDLAAAIGRAAADAGSHNYGFIEGEPALRDAYAAHLSALYAADISADHTMITSGCNQAFITAALTIAGPGDKVLMTNPCYFNHEATLKMLGITTGYIDVSATDGFIPTPDAVAAAITPDVRAVALVNPNNPTGAIIPADTLAAIMDVCRARGIILILDETYRDFLPRTDAIAKNADEKPMHNLMQQPWQDVLIGVYSFSKSYCIPGHRLGAILAAPSLIAEMAKVMDNIQICAPRAPQIALAPMITELAEWRAANRQEMADRAAAFQHAFEGLDGWQIMSQGAYFGYVQHPRSGNTISSVDVAAQLCRDAGVLTIPGDFFGTGQGQFLRFAFANADVAMITELPSRLFIFQS